MSILGINVCAVRVNGTYIRDLKQSRRAVRKNWSPFVAFGWQVKVCLQLLWGKVVASAV